MKLQHIFLAGMLALSVSACDVLDVEPNDRINAETVFQDRRGVEAALTGAYNVLQSAALTRELYVLTDLAADNLVASGSKIELDDISDNQPRANNLSLESIWNASYDGINRVNNIIANIGEVERLTEDERNSLLGQARFLRAYHYFNLVRLFGPVPLHKEPVTNIRPETINISRASSEAVYRFIVEDLQEAERILPAVTNSYEASAGAARALLSRVYLETANWQAAAEKAGEVINMDYSLEMDDYTTLFNEGGNGEIILQTDFTISQAFNPLVEYLLPTAASNPLGVKGRGEVSATQNLFNAFSEEDERQFATVLLTDDGKTYFASKYTKSSVPGDDIILLRLGEMYLNRAEANLKKANPATEEAREDINTIRQRAGLNPVTTSDPEQLLEILLEERRKELAFEGHRWFDLRRFNKLEEALREKDTFESEDQFLFPVPQSEIDANEAIGPEDQNPGY